MALWGLDGGWMGGMDGWMDGQMNGWVDDLNLSAASLATVSQLISTCQLLDS